MSAILYNTNSSLIPKFQRYRQRRGSPDAASPLSRPGASQNGPDLDVPFESVHEKNSDAYLQELCCSVYPTSLHRRVRKLNPTNGLPVHAFMCLIWKNFVTSWYNVKIRATDDRFMVQLFELVDEIVLRLKMVDVCYESLLADELPLLLSEHMNAMRLCLRKDNVYKCYCQLTFYEDNYYPQVLSNYLLSSVRCDSSLETTFLQGLLNDLLLGKILDKITEPYYVVAAINKICDAWETRRCLAQDKADRGAFQRLKRGIARVGQTIALLTSMNKNSGDALSRPFPYMRGFTLVFVDLLKFPQRKPYLYALGKTLQYWSAKSKSLNAIMQNLFFNVVTRSLRDMSVRSASESLRLAVFPNDNKLGPGKDIPVGKEYEEFVSASIEKQWRLVNSLGLNSVLGIDRAQIEELNEMIGRDKRCNKLLVFRIIDCLLAHTKAPL